MDSKEIDDLSKAMKKYAAKLSKNPKAAKAFLIAAGILTKKGNFRAPYKHLYLLLAPNK